MESHTETCPRLGIAAALLGDPATHLMAEMAQTAEHLVVIGRGRLIADTTVADVLAQASQYAAVIGPHAPGRRAA